MEEDAASQAERDEHKRDAQEQKDAEAKLSEQLASVRGEVASVVEAVKRLAEVQEGDKRDRQAAMDAARDTESKLAGEVEEVRSQVVALRNATNIEGELHKGLSDVENAVAGE